MTTARSERVKAVARIVLAVLMVSVGLLHFIAPEGFVKIVPKMLPAPLFLVYLSGFFEMLGGVGILIPRTRRAAGYGLIALYLAVFPANINMAVNDLQPEHVTLPAALLWLRLPFQIAFIAWAWWCTRSTPVAGDRAKRPT